MVWNCLREYHHRGVHDVNDVLDYVVCVDDLLEACCTGVLCVDTGVICRVINYGSVSIQHVLQDVGTIVAHKWS